MTTPDVQSLADERGIAIDEVGIAGLRLPVRIAAAGGAAQATVAEVAMNVDLDATTKGTHMSRFVEVITEHRDALDAHAVGALAQELRRRLESRRARVEIAFPYFLERTAPVTGGAALVEYRGALGAEAGAALTLSVGARIPVASLCPCSKEISDYGAHNQRGYVDVEVEFDGPRAATIAIDELVAIAESAASAPLYTLLKRPDERFVTMRAYEKPAFVEDIARDVALALRDDARVERFAVTVRNLESIHAHDAVATIRGGRAGPS